MLQILNQIYKHYIKSIILILPELMVQIDDRQSFDSEQWLDRMYCIKQYTIVHFFLYNDSLYLKQSLHFNVFTFMFYSKDGVIYGADLKVMRVFCYSIIFLLLCI